MWGFFLLFVFGEKGRVREKMDKERGRERKRERTQSCRASREMGELCEEFGEKKNISKFLVRHDGN